jgi:serine/threonine protein kinase
VKRENTTTALSTNDGWWNEPILPQRGGIIWMKPGMRIEEALEACKTTIDHTCASVFGFLRVLHSAERVHRDIRPPNILFFEGLKNSVQLIDYGYSARVKSIFPKPHHVQGIMDNAGDRINTSSDKQWYYHDDFEMLAVCLMKLLIPHFEPQRERIKELTFSK